MIQNGQNSITGKWYFFSSVEIECHSFDGFTIFPEVWSLDTTELGFEIGDYMCWIEILRNVKYQVADKDIEVYKIVTLANKQSCVSIIKNFNYTANILYKIPTLECNEIARRYGTLKIEKAYHSYTGVQFVCNSAFHIVKGIYRCKRMIFGNRRMFIPFENDSYIATFIIPKGAVYTINSCGEIVSNKIRYTGKYIKL